MAHSWGYCTENGPLTWHKNYPIANGQRQSPIDINPRQTEHDPDLHAFTVTYPDFHHAKVSNNGHTVMFEPADDEHHHIELSGGPLHNKYKFAQFHFHWGEPNKGGSEHTVDHKQYPAELHLVHWNVEKYKTFGEAVTAEDGLSVIGVFLEVGEEEHEGIKDFIDAMQHVKAAGSSYVMENEFNPKDILPDCHAYWTYPGSLTTPPLKECVTWIVLEHPITISYSQMETFRHLDDFHQNSIEGNFRPVCDLKKRTIRASFKDKENEIHCCCDHHGHHPKHHHDDDHHNNHKDHHDDNHHGHHHHNKHSCHHH